MEPQNKITYCEKPEWISYDDIHDVLWDANTANREDGFVLSTSKMNGEQLKNRIGSDGHCFVALSDGNVIGTLSIRYIKRNSWFAKGKVADYMLAGVKQEFQGYHVNSTLSKMAFDKAREDGCSVMELDTAETNTHAIAVYKHFGFRLVDYKANPGGDHYSVIMIKWLDGSPYPEIYCTIRYLIKKIYVRIRYRANREKRFGRLSLLIHPKLNKEMNKWAKRYHGRQTELPLRKIKSDMHSEILRRSMLTNEYYKYQIYQKAEPDRAAYFLDWERKKLFTSGKWNIFPRDKFERFQLFKDFYHRDIVVIRTSEEQADEEYSKFKAKHERFIAKPVAGVKGKGIQFLNSSEVPVVKDLAGLAGGELLLEEIIEQGNELAVFHPGSVNTLRMVTAVADDGEVVILFALFRSGRGGSIVDNVGSGGIIAMVDTSTGTVVTDGLCGMEWYEVHPDSNVRFKGTQMPEWEKVCSIAKDAHKTLPKQRLIGWDFAWTTGGWDVVETNPSPSFESIQVLMGQGMRQRLKTVFGTL